MGRKKKKRIKGFDIDNLKYYYGIPHSHTSFSTGKGSPQEAYEYGRKAGLNFMMITDHNSFLSDKVHIKDNIYNKFQATKYHASKIRKKDDNFLPLVGFETKTNLYGDFNIINSETFFKGAVKDLKILALWMLNNPDAFISINHPHKNIKGLPYNPILNKMITSIEVGNGSLDGKYTRHEKYYFSLLDNGWKLGAINGQDNHKMNFGDSENLTVCICNSLSKREIITAFRKKRTYSTESKYLKFHFTINDKFMGESLSPLNEKLRFMIFCEDIKYKIREIQIISNQGNIIKKIEEINLNSIKYLYEHKREKSETWFVIKIIQENNKVSFSSPIFISLEDDNY
ncbi:MAG: CehA/McbA family metallohydrolase [Clostridiales bacterium]|nr:CehA/McbA family metallohydrolase [Clostridiales bacterium]